MDRDNQAGKIGAIGWISGFFDGEGYIGLWKRTDHKRGYKDTYRPSVVMVNTHKVTIEHLSKLLDSYEIPHYIKVHTPEKRSWREYWTVEISGFERIKKFISLVEDTVITKKIQVELMKEFLERRSSVTKNTPYIERDHQIYEELKQLKRT